MKNTTLNGKNFKLNLPEFNLRNHYQLLKENHPFYKELNQPQ